MYEDFENVWVTEPKKHIGNEMFVDRITLAELYRQGWWITEIFGSYATVVSESPYHLRYNNYEKGRPYFRCKQCQVNVSALTPAILRKIKRIQESKWKQYKRILTEPKKSQYDRRYC